MATRKNPTDPETPDAAAAAGETGDPTNPETGAAAASGPDRSQSVRMVYAYDTNTPKPHRKLDRPVPESWLEQFPNLKQVPSEKADTTDTEKAGK